MIELHNTNIYYFSFFNITRNGYIHRFNIYHIGCSLDYHSYLGKLVLELQVNRSVVACIVCRSPQHVGHRVIQKLKPKVHTASIGGMRDTRQ